VLAEAAAFPPEKALTVEPLATTGLVGISPPAGELRLNFLWVNHADFPIQIRDVNVKARVGGNEWEWDLWNRDQFELRGRTHMERGIKGPPSVKLPLFENLAVICEVTMEAHVSGPWEGGHAYQTHRLVKSSLWVPATGMVAVPTTSLISNDADVDLVLEAVLYEHFLKVPVVNLHYADVDREKKLREGATKQRLPHVARKLGHSIDAGAELARVSERQMLPDGGWSSSDDDY
jgi:hypothetical protein